MEVEAVERPQSYKIDGNDSAWNYRQLIRKPEMRHLRISKDPGEAVTMFVNHNYRRVNNARQKLVKRQAALYDALEFERSYLNGQSD